MLTETPKRVPTSDVSNRVWPTYYAGYSPDFVRDAIVNLGLGRGARIADPWNGAGTTTSVARDTGIRSFGYDINPAVVLLAKARLLGSDVFPSVESLGRTLVSDARKKKFASVGDEPLELWFTSAGASVFRRLERTIRQALISENAPALSTSRSLSHVSTLAAHYYVSLFRALRTFLKPFHGSNPTWIRLPAEPKNRLRPSFEAVAEAFLGELVQGSTTLIPPKEGPPSSSASPHNDTSVASRKVVTTVDLSDSIDLPLDTESVDAVIASPPYCTRIDYAVATWPELALLGMSTSEFRLLRESTIGACIAPDKIPSQKTEWGRTCAKLLSGIKSHPSHGSRTYYYRNHVAYFDRLYRSLGETWRVLRPTGHSILVVQDSHYKELHTDLQQIVTEMMRGIGFTLKDRKDYHIPTTKAAVNTRSRRYRDTVHATESALVFSCARR
jgi:DNA modification methylase